MINSTELPILVSLGSLLVAAISLYYAKFQRPNFELIQLGLGGKVDPLTGHLDHLRLALLNHGARTGVVTSITLKVNDKLVPALNAIQVLDIDLLKLNNYSQPVSFALRANESQILNVRLNYSNLPVPQTSAQIIATLPDQVILSLDPAKSSKRRFQGEFVPLSALSDKSQLKSFQIVIQTAHGQTLVSDKYLCNA